MATYTDSFDRANGALGANWTTAGFSDASGEISSNHAISPGSNVYEIWSGDGTWGREQYSEVEIGVVHSDRAGPCVYMDDAHGCYWIQVRPDNGAYQFMKIDAAGAETQIGLGQSFGAALVVTDKVRLKAENDGSGNTLLTAYLNGVSDSTHTDSTSPYTSGKPGMSIHQYARSELESWTGDDFAVAAAETVTATVTDQTGTALPNETGIDWHWTDSFNGNPTDTGTGETTDGSGVIVVDLSNTTLTTGQFGYLTVKLSNGNVGIAREAID